MLTGILQFVILMYYRYIWKDVTGFISDIDHGKQFMQDFAYHYYPMGLQILKNPVPVTGYFYSSFFAVMLIPVTMLPLEPALVVWCIFQVVCVFGLFIVSARGLLKLTPPGMMIYLVLFATSFPILHNMKWGQVSVLMIFCVVTSFYLANQKRSALAGSLLAWAAAIKYFPFFFASYFILNRDTRTCAAFTLAGCFFFFVVPATILGFDGWLNFEAEIFRSIGDASWIDQNVNSQYIVHVGIRWYSIIFNKGADESFAQILKIIGYFLALTCIVMVCVLKRNPICEKKGVCIVPVFLAVPFILKTSWPHYFVYLPICQAITYTYFVSSGWQARWLRYMLIPVPVISGMLSSVFLFRLFAGWDQYNSYGILFIANLVLWMAILGAIIVLSIAPKRCTQESPPPRST